MMVRKILIGSMLAFTMSGVAAAEGPYVGAKVASMNADDVSGISLDSATNAGIVLGYEFLADYGLGVEAEFTTSVSDGEWSYLGFTGDWDVSTQALYLVSRLGQEAYLKVKAGWLREDGTVNVLGTEYSGDDTGASFGLGGGYKFNQNVSAEVEWTKIEQDIDAWSAGVNYSF